VAEDWVTLFLSPIGHELNSWLEYHPSAKAGMGAAAQAYEYVRTSNGGVESQHYFLTSDLTQASEMLVREYLRPALLRFAMEVGLKGAYIKAAIHLLTGARRIAAGPPHYPYVGMTTKRGCLMGDPGTKCALMLNMLIAEELAYRQYTLPPSAWHAKTPKKLWRQFVAAGDDHFARGPREYLEAITRNLIDSGAEISLEKSYLSKIGGYFTEELILNLPDTIWYEVDPANPKRYLRLQDRDYARTAHVDSVKIRLLSPCSKLTAESFDEGNPAVGKWMYLCKKIAWLPPALKGTLSQLVCDRFHYRFNRFVDWDDVFTYIPHQFGGLHFPCASSAVLFDKIIELPEIVKAAMCAVCEADCPYAIRSALYSYRANSSYRGRSINDLLLE
jgi:hypothetical protein